MSHCLLCGRKSQTKYCQDCIVQRIGKPPLKTEATPKIVNPFDIIDPYTGRGVNDFNLDPFFDDAFANQWMGSWSSPFEDEQKRRMREEGEAHEKAQDEERHRIEEEKKRFEQQRQKNSYQWGWSTWGQQKRESNYYSPFERNPFEEFFSKEFFKQTPPKMDGSVTVEIDKKRLLGLIALCHPDKHANSIRATEATQWLLDLKSKITKSEAA